MEEEQIRRIIRVEIDKAIMDNIDSTYIFNYVRKLEDENNKLKQLFNKIKNGEEYEIKELLND